MSEGTCIIFVERPLPLRDDSWAEIPVEIVYEFWPEEPATNWYPGRPCAVEIQSTSIPLTWEETDRAESACWKDVRKRIAEAKEP